MDELERPDGISRRRMLKRIGAGAAIAWSAPILTSLRVPAFAQYTSSACPECFTLDCGTTSFFDCFCVAGSSGALFCANDFFCGDTPPCQTDANCPQGWACQTAPCAGFCGPVCVPPCGTQAATTTGTGPQNSQR